MTCPASAFDADVPFDREGVLVVMVLSHWMDWEIRMAQEEVIGDKR